MRRDYENAHILCPYYKWSKTKIIYCENAQVGCVNVGHFFRSAEDKARYCRRVCESWNYKELCPMARENERYYRGEAEQVDWKKRNRMDVRFEKNGIGIQIVTEGEGSNKRTSLYACSGNERQKLAKFASLDDAELFANCLSFWLNGGRRPEVKGNA